MKCPKCKGKVDYFEVFVSGHGIYHFFPKDKTYKFIKFESNDVLQEYMCPLCEWIIANTDKEMLEIMNNRRKKQ